MSKDNFIMLSREFSFEEDWTNARPTHQSIFLTILLNMAFKETSQIHNGHKVIVKACQLYISQRRLAKLSSKFITKDDVEGALKYFKKCNFLLHEVLHEKTMITVTQSDVCNSFIKQTPPLSTPSFRQASANKEERQEVKEIKETTTTSESVAVVFSILNDLEISNEDKIYLSSNFSEENIINAIKFVKQPGFKAKKDLMSTLVWACKENPKIVPLNAKFDDSERLNQIIKLNEEKSKYIKKKYDPKLNDNQKITVNRVSIEFRDKIRNITRIIGFSEENFDNDCLFALNELLNNNLSQLEKNQMQEELKQN